MVVTIPLRRPIPPKPGPDEAERAIDGGPIYLDLDWIRGHASSATIFVATDKATIDLVALDWDLDDLSAAMKCLTAEDYESSAWCKTSSRMWIACDVYIAPFDRLENCRLAQKGRRYYLKFGFRENVVGPAIPVIVVSIHPSF